MQRRFRASIAATCLLAGAMGGAGTLLGPGEVAAVNSLRYDRMQGYPPGGSSSRGPCRTVGHPDFLLVRRTIAWRQDRGLHNTKPFARTVRDTPVMQRLYGAICTLPRAQAPERGKPWVLTCQWQGVEYHLSFRRGRLRLLLVSADTGSCPLLFVGSQGAPGPHGIKAPSYWLGKSPFWCLLSRALGVAEFDLFPHVTGDTPTQEEKACSRHIGK